MIIKTAVIGFEIWDGAFYGDSFIDFINKKLKIQFQNNPEDIHIMGKCRFHHHSDVKKTLNINQINFCFLPPYSPQVNPIEEYFSHLKYVIVFNILKLRTTYQLKERIEYILSHDLINFDGWFRTIRRWNDKALTRQPFI